MAEPWTILAVISLRAEVWLTWTVVETEVASSLNFSILIDHSRMIYIECVDFVSSTGFRGSGVCKYYIGPIGDRPLC